MGAWTKEEYNEYGGNEGIIWRNRHLEEEVLKHTEETRNLMANPITISSRSKRQGMAWDQPHLVITTECSLRVWLL